jgi:DNA-directed RNA polymerase specialized sigma24 family protein
VDRARRRAARNRAEEEWVRRFSEADRSRRRELAWIFLGEHRRRILEVALPQARARMSAMVWACFDGRLVQGRTAAEIAARLGIKPQAVYVYASRGLVEVRRRCAEIEGEFGDDDDFDLS